ncbi:hypothetical protein HK101_009072 [Irineochytrium annulatum]|nr:hypothetical protein HK101_009072 [Irineochytrium annulatum]
MPWCPNEIVDHIVAYFNPRDALDRLTLVRCHLVSHSFLTAAAPVLWLAAELSTRRTIRLRWPDAFKDPKTVEIPRVVLRLFACSSKTRVGSLWQWRLYLGAVRGMTFASHRPIRTERVDAGVLGPWLSRLDQVRMGNEVLGVGWTAWLKGRWAAGEAARSITLHCAEVVLAEVLLGHEDVRDVCFGMAVNGQDLRRLLRFLKHGVETIRVGWVSGDEPPTADLSFQDLDVLSSLNEYAHRHPGSIDRPIFGGLPVVALNMVSRGLDGFALSSLRTTLQMVAIREYSADLAHNLKSLAVLESLRIDRVVSKQFTLPQSLQHLNLSNVQMVQTVRRDNAQAENELDLQSLIVAFQHVPQLQSLTIEINADCKFELDAIVANLPRLQDLDVRVDALGCTLVGWMRLQRVKLHNVMLIVDGSLFASKGTPKLFHLIVSADQNYPTVIDFGGHECVDALEWLLSARRVAARLSTLALQHLV